MSSQKPYKKKSSAAPQQQPRPAESHNPASSFVSESFWSKPFTPYLVIFLLSCGVYFNTLTNKYASDDTLVLTENKFTLQGFGGIKDLLTHDAFVGFFGERGAELVSGGRYRPLSMVSLAIEVQFFGLNPTVSHGVNILLFALSCLLLYRILSELMPPKRDRPFYISIAFIATVLFAAHPIHTEVVANIKGRDEIMGLLFSLLALYAGLRYVRTQNLLHLLWGTAVYFLALLSKENAITFIAIIPLTYYFFTKAEKKNYIITVSLYIIPILLFIYIRTLYTKSGIGAESPEILNNPFAYLPKTTEGMIQRYATIIMSFLLYFKLLIFPHPLTHDYYYNQIPIIGAGDPLFILSLVINAGLVIYALLNLTKKTVASYAILFYFLAFSIVSNLAFTVGILMNERFAYACSIGFVLLMAYLLVKARDKYKLSNNIVAGILIVLLALYSVKSISRNPVWKDNLTLFLVDSKTSTNSSKVQMSAGGDLMKFADENFDTIRKNGRLKYVMGLLEMNENNINQPDSVLRKEFLQMSVAYLKRTLEIYPTHSNALVMLGNAQYKVDHDPAKAIESYQKAAAYHVGGFYDAWYNMGCVEIEHNQSGSAKENFLKALQIKPDEFACRFNLAVAYSNLNMADSALYWYQKTLELKPLDAVTYYKIGTIYGKEMGNLEKAAEYITQAIKYNPDIPVYYEDLGVAYGMQGKADDAIRVSLDCLKKFPTYLPALRNLSISYRKKNDINSAMQYEAQIAKLSGH